MYFKRLNNKYIKTLNDLTLQPQPASTTTTNSITLSKKEQIDILATRTYGAGNEGLFYKIAYKNADQLLAWDLDNSYVNVINVPNRNDYT
jgi:hypothetical protein